MRGKDETSDAVRADFAQQPLVIFGIFVAVHTAVNGDPQLGPLQPQAAHFTAQCQGEPVVRKIWGRVEKNNRVAGEVRWVVNYKGAVAPARLHKSVAAKQSERALH